MSIMATLKSMLGLGHRCEVKVDLSQAMHALEHAHRRNMKAGTVSLRRADATQMVLEARMDQLRSRDDPPAGPPKVVSDLVEFMRKRHEAGRP